jgi:hypothetical protein
MEIINELAPHWKIVSTRNTHFDAIEIDEEFMDYEKKYYPNSYCIVLNTTEFMFPTRPLKELVPLEKDQCFEITAYPAYRDGEYEANTLKELVSGITHLGPPVRRFRSPRYIHSHPCGKYTIGRHSTELQSKLLMGIWIIWTGYYPWCDAQRKRKMQIKQKMSERDIKLGRGHQHCLSPKGMEDQKEFLKSIAVPIEQENPALARMFQDLNR